MVYRNIHLPEQPEDHDDSPAASPSESTVPEESRPLPRLRSLKNDPAREYAQRPGQVEPLPDAVAALILCKSGLAKVERHQLKVTLEGIEHFFASSNSITIATKNGTDERVLWVINRHSPDVLHILGRDGEYIESIPRKGSAEWFSSDEASSDAFAETKRMRNRDMTRLNEIHAPDFKAALEREQHNTGEVTRLVNTFPAAGATPGESRIPSIPSMPRAETAAQAIASTDRQRARHKSTAREEEARNRSASLVAMALEETLEINPPTSTPQQENEEETIW